ncbi:hypothetical protein [Streptomyces camelliae]|uniref:Universal stress protein n=1 Tax=Streptomyces camelliae TaxID=3004093 RepID=A0ABY7PHI1_9ACTN|nr:hypothetical protein [Streptomyces sp. HUAS 2-6]WBO69040.1 hypothetical protein O1G22_42925 [Streptomyces sp. HUAS 2-6]
MTKSGASGPKARARKTQDAAGVRYTQVRRRMVPASRHGRVVQFLFDEQCELGTLTVQIASAWAQQGLRVLLVHKYKPYGSDLRLYSRKARERKAAEERQRAWPGHRSTLLRADIRDRGRGGLLVEQHTPWSHPPTDPRRPSLDEGPLQDALQLGRRHFDALVLMGQPTWPRRDLVDHFVVLAASNGVPVAETLGHGAVPEERIDRPLTPEQSAALLRERHLKFLYHRPTAFLGMITGSRKQPAAEPVSGFSRLVEVDMAAAGIPLLGHIRVGDYDLATHHHRTHDTEALANSPLDPGVEQAAKAITDRWC